MKSGYSRETISANIAALLREGHPRPQAVAAAHQAARAAYWKRFPSGFLPAWIYPPKDGRRMQNLPPKTRKNPARRDADDAAYLAERFNGRAPDWEELHDKPVIPDVMAAIGKIFAVEYIAERDGKEYRFRHVFKARSRPHLAVSPDGNLALMIGGSWVFTEDGFEDI